MAAISPRDHDRRQCATPGVRALTTGPGLTTFTAIASVDNALSLTTVSVGAGLLAGLATARPLTDDPPVREGSVRARGGRLAPDHDRRQCAAPGVRALTTGPGLTTFTAIASVDNALSLTTVSVGAGPLAGLATARPLTDDPPLHEGNARTRGGHLAP